MSGRWWKAPEAAFLDRRLQKLPAGLFRLWFNLNCVASWSGGRLPSLDDVGFLLRTSRASLERRIDALRAAGLIEQIDGELRPVACEDRNGARDGGEPMSGAERTRIWRERRSRDAAGDDCVTPSDAIEKDIEQKDSETDAARGRAEGEAFEEFWKAFPKRDGDNAEAPARAAWRKAIATGERPDTIIAAAKDYASATARRERQYIASASRWLGEERWRGAAPPKGAPGVWIKQGSPEWVPWSDHWRATKGKSPPVDAKGGWRFPSRIPPAPLEQAA